MATVCPGLVGRLIACDTIFFFFLLSLCGTEDLTVNKMWQFAFLFVRMRIIKKIWKFYWMESWKPFEENGTSWGSSCFTSVFLSMPDLLLLPPHPFTVMLIPPPALSTLWLLSSTEVSEVREVMLSGRTELRIKGFSSVRLQIGTCWTRLGILNSQWGHWTGTCGSLILFLVFFYLLCSAY